MLLRRSKFRIIKKPLAFIILTSALFWIFTFNAWRDDAVNLFNVSLPLEPTSIYNSILCFGNKMPSHNVSAIICYHDDIEDPVSDHIKNGQVHEPRILSIKMLIFCKVLIFSLF